MLTALVLLAPACFSGAEVQQPGAPRPTVWMGPPSYDNGKCFRELFEKPDGWKETRSAVDVLMVADHCLDKQFTDDELRAWFALLKKWNLKLSLEVGAVKPWGTTGEKTFSIERPKWDRFTRLGANIYAIAMDEPLLCCRKRELPFSLIYWASGYPPLAKRGLADDSTWYVSVMQQGYDYAMVHGSPDHYVVQSWLQAPSRSTPETAPYSFTRSVLDFTRRFVGRGRD